MSEERTVVDASSAALDRELPPRLAERLAVAYDVDGPAETVGDFVRVVEATVSEYDGDIEDALCSADESRHRIDIDGETRYYHCVVDPLVLQALRDEPATVRSSIRSDEVVFEIDDAVAVSPADAVLSFGIAEEVERGGCLDPEQAYRQICAYVNAFPSTEAYEEWAGDVPAVTTAVPVEIGVAFARALAGEFDVEFDVEFDGA